MKLFKAIFSLLFVSIISMFITSCVDGGQVRNTSAIDEQKHSETLQRNFNETQPLPNITWSMERDNLIKYKKLQNDRSVNFYVYVYNEGVAMPIGYYIVNKLSSVNSQLSCPEQIINGRENGNNLPAGQIAVISSPSEDGSYGTNGDAVFGFTPDDVCIQTNMHYVCLTIPLQIKNIPCFGAITTAQAAAILNNTKEVMSRK